MEKKCPIQSKIYEKKTSHQNQSSNKPSFAFLMQTSFISLNQFLDDERTSLNERPLTKNDDENDNDIDIGDDDDRKDQDSAPSQQQNQQRAPINVAVNNSCV